jgi:hypothetical protein
MFNERIETIDSLRKKKEKQKYNYSGIKITA